LIIKERTQELTIANEFKPEIIIPTVEKALRKAGTAKCHPAA
jgi:hypothetical protein